MDRRLVVFFATRPAHGLAIDRYHARRDASDRGDPGHEATLKLFGIEGCEDVADPVMRRCAVAERSKPAQQGQLLLAEPGNVGERFRAGQGGEQGQQQHLIKRVNHLAGLTAIRQVHEIVEKDRGLENFSILLCRHVHRDPQTRTEGPHRFSTSAVCHVLLHPIAL